MKKVIVFLVCMLFIAGNFFPAGAQEGSSPKELVINKQDLINALRQISDAVWEIEEQKALPQVEELALQYRLDRLEKMILDLSIYLGLNPAVMGGQSIIIDRTRDMPVSSYYPGQVANAIGLQRRSGVGAQYPSSFQGSPSDSTGQSYPPVTQQLLAQGSLLSDSLQLLIQSLSLQLNNLQRLANSVLAYEAVVVPDPNAVQDSIVVSASADITRETVRFGFDRFKSQVFFAISSASLTSESKKTLDEVIDIMKRNAGLIVTLSGSSSREGNASYNERLSKERAESVRNYLNDAGINMDRIVLGSYGIDEESDLLLYGRRVDIVLEQM